MRGTPQSVRRTPSASHATPSAGGPLGTYRNLHRSTVTPMRASALWDEPASLGKRSYSASGLSRDDPRSPPLPLSATPRSQRKGEASTDGYELTMLRTDYERRIQDEQHAYRLLESQLRAQSRELEALKAQRAEVLQEWEVERASHLAKQEAWASAKRTMEEDTATLRSEARTYSEARDAWEARFKTLESTAHSEKADLSMQLVAARSEAEQAHAQAEHWQQAHARLVEERANEAPAQPHAPPAKDDTDLLKDQLSRTSPNSPRTTRRRPKAGECASTADQGERASA